MIPVSNTRKSLKQVIGALFFGLAFLACLSPWGKAWDNICYDLLFLLRGPEPPAREIVIVAIDEASFGALELQWPWPRQVHAALLDSLFEAGAKTVVMDVLFPECSQAEADAALRDALVRHPLVILGEELSWEDQAGFSRQIIVRPHPLLIGPDTKAGLINLPVDPDGFVRNAGTLRMPGKLLSEAAVIAFTGRNPTSKLKPGDRINFAGPAQTYQTISYYQALSPQTHLPDGFLKDKLVFVGLNIQHMADLTKAGPDQYPIPFSRWGKGYVPGVEIQATMAAGLMHDSFIQVISLPLVLVVSLVTGAAALFLFFRINPMAGGGILALYWLAGAGLAFFLFVQYQFYLPFLLICLPVTGLYFTSPFFHYMDNRREKKYIRQVFSTYVAPSVVRQLMADPRSLELGGEEREITAFFSDVEGFTSISEKLTPKALVSLLNEFLTEMTDIILDHQGTVDKFEGDAIIAMFGAPGLRPDHAKLACSASIAMQNRLAELRSDWVQRGLPALKMRIGMVTGPAVVGNMGSSRRMDYTMMGDTVNTASRLEGVNKIYSTYCMVGESTRKSAGDEVVAREVDRLAVIGKKETIRVYELMGFKDRTDERVLRLVQTYEQGLAAYRQQEWQTAESLFAVALEIIPEDGPSRTLLTRCREFKARPPDKSWDGAYHMKTK